MIAVDDMSLVKPEVMCTVVNAILKVLYGLIMPFAVTKNLADAGLNHVVSDQEQKIQIGHAIAPINFVASDM